MSVLRLREHGGGGRGHGGEVFDCSYTPDSRHVLTGGWDGHLRLWDSASGAQVAAFRVSDKPIAACAVSPRGDEWHSGALDGLLATWDASSGTQITAFTPHAKPLSAIVFGPDGLSMATGSWDKNLMIWDLSRDRQGRTLMGHEDIVAGCSFTNSGQKLLSWSYDGTLRVWDVETAQLTQTIAAHRDRILSGSVSPDGSLAVTGGRSHGLRLWDWQKGKELQSKDLGAEVRACMFLLDGQSLVTVDAPGRVVLWSMPQCKPLEELVTHFPTQSADLAPSGSEIVLGGEDGCVRFVALDGLEQRPLLTTLFAGAKRTSTTLQRLFGKSTLTVVYRGPCPVCRTSLELPERPTEPIPCPGCNRMLKIFGFAPVVQKRRERSAAGRLGE